MTYFELITCGWKPDKIEDMVKLQDLVPILRAVPLPELAKWWDIYSTEFCAQWLIVDAERANDFKEWLLEERH